jgi:mono/diheme cytochrome c family protein
MSPSIHLVLGCALWLPGCATLPVGATDAELAHGDQSAPRGAMVFASECARCHGRRGQGVADAPAILGPGALPEYQRENPGSGVRGLHDPQQMEIEQQTQRTGAKMRRPFRNAWDVYAFVRTHGHGPRFRTPDAKAAHDWAAVTFLMATQGAQLPLLGLTEENASTVTVPQR